MSVGIVLLFPYTGWGLMASNNSRIILLDKLDDSAHIFLGISFNVENGHMMTSAHGREQYVGWKTETEWPLEQIVYAGGTISISFLQDFQLNAGVWKTLNEQAGIMKDSTLSYGDFNEEEIIYSESNSTVNGSQIDANLRYNLLKRERMSLDVIAGYSYINREWEAGAGYERVVYPLNFPAESAAKIGPIAEFGRTYEEKLRIPYFGFSFSMTPAHNYFNDSPFGLTVYTLYSPLAECDSEDENLFNFTKGEGTAKGMFFSLGGEFLIKFRGSWTLTATIDYTSYDLDGDQDLFSYSSDLSGTWFNDLAVKGHQTYLGLMVGYAL